MIQQKCFTGEWIRKVSTLFHYPDVNLIEKVIRAFSLVTMLSDAGCPFIWKGGTSLMILLGETRHRLSIDVDIICPPGTQIGDYLKDFQKYGFNLIEKIERIQPGNDIPKSHSKFFYRLAFSDNDANNGSILLDVLYEDNLYNKIKVLPLTSPFIEWEGEPVMVNIPSIDDILGDKLTAFAPNTSGIPYFKGDHDCNLEIIKQLYDIGRLFNKMTDLSVVASSYKKICSVELAYRHKEKNPETALRDTRETALCLCTHGKAGIGDFPALQNGVSRLRSFMYLGKYQIEQAQADAAKAAYLATLIETRASSFAFYPGYIEEGLRLSKAVPVKLGKLRLPSPEAYYYWVKIGELLKFQ